MKTKMRPRYYCDHCGKGNGSPSYMRRHESGCTLNPKRVCGMCHDGRIGPTKTPAELLAILNADGFAALREAVGDCPACILATLRQLPDYVPDVTAGASGPIQLTPWKVSALRVMAHLERHGAITRKEIRAIGCDPTRWCQHWLAPHNDRNGVYVAGSKTPRFDQQHPRVYAEILAKVAT